MKEDPFNYENLVPNSNEYSKTFVNINSSTIRISILEDRTKTLEKMIRLIEERLNMKEEEKLNELKTIESNNVIINKLNKKINNLENKLKEFEHQKKISDEEYNKKISYLNEKIKYLEEHLSINKINDINIKSQNDIKNNRNNNILIKEKKVNINLEDFNELIKNNNIQMDELMNEKIYNAGIDNENKINELLNLIHDINKILEENENKMNSIIDNFNKFQNDNINIIQAISIYEEKINNIDYLNNEINELKMKINNMNNHFDDKYEEEKFTHQYLNSITIK